MDHHTSVPSQNQVVGRPAPAGGLSTAHIGPLPLGPEGERTFSSASMRLAGRSDVIGDARGDAVPGYASFRDGGSVVEVRPGRADLRYRQAGGGRRGNVQQFTKASRRRLLRRVGSLERAVLPLFVTLTYPAEWPENPREWKRHLKAFFKRLRRRYCRSSAIWKLEFQVRGAPHFHLLLYGIGGDITEFREWLSRAWYEVCATGDILHLRAGTNAQEIRSHRGVMNYASKYLGKPEDYQEGVGRYWGVFGAEFLPLAPLVTIPLSDTAVFRLNRWLRRHGRIKAGDYRRRRLTVLCDARQWLRLVGLALE